MANDVWVTGAAYEPYVGRWSRLVAREFLAWLALPSGRRWLDVGCGTGALTQTILAVASPAQVKAIDPSVRFLEYAISQTDDPRATFAIGDAQALPEDANSYDAVVAGLSLNFVPRPEAALREMTRVVRPGGVVAVYVWDYSGEMQMMRCFWDAAAALDPAALSLVEGSRFEFCQPEPLTRLFSEAGLNGVEVRALDIPTVFRDFDDYWTPFLGGQGPAPSYVMSLSEEKRTALREEIRARLPVEADGSIHLIARAWGAKGKKNS